ncbi:MAG: Cys-tRNA(Pro) deacylase [Pseudomonadales bacterium]
MSTPAITALEQAGTPYTLHKYAVAADSELSYGAVAAQALGVPVVQVFKTLIAELDTTELVVAVVPVSGQLNLRALAQAAGAKKAVMAEPGKAEKSSGYVTGGISPFGQRKRLRTFVENSAIGLDRMYVSAGKRGLQLAVSPADLVKLTGASIL